MFWGVMPTHLRQMFLVQLTFISNFFGTCNNTAFCYMTPDNSLTPANSSPNLISHFEYICSKKVARKMSPQNSEENLIFNGIL